MPPCGASGDAARDDRERRGVPRCPGALGPLRYTLGPADGSMRLTPGERRREPDDGHDHRILLRTLRHAVLLRADREATPRRDRPRPRSHPRPEELRRERRHADDRGDGRGPERHRARRRPAPARCLPQDLQLLHVLPAVHVCELLEREGRRVPHLRARPDPRGASRAVPRSAGRWTQGDRRPAPGRRGPGGIRVADRGSRARHGRRRQGRRRGAGDRGCRADPADPPARRRTAGPGPSRHVRRVVHPRGGGRADLGRARRDRDGPGHGAARPGACRG